MKYEMWGTNNGLNNAWVLFYQTQLPENKFVVLLGNNTWGEVYNTKEDLIKGWKRCLAMSWNQDLTLFYNGKPIRSIINFNKKITEKDIKYPCIYNKYNFVLN